MRRRYIAVEGPIGVGKAGTVTALEKRLGATAIRDMPNPFLDGFYRDMEKYAFQAQLFFLLSRFQQQRDLAQGDLFSQTVVCDYLFQKDRLFASLTLREGEYALYEKVYSLLQGTIAAPDVIVGLMADADTLLDRISRRNESLALVLPKSYLMEIINAFQTFFFHYADAPVIVCDTSNADFAVDEKNVDLLVRMIDEVRSGVHYLNPRPS